MPPIVSYAHSSHSKSTLSSIFGTSLSDAFNGLSSDSSFLDTIAGFGSMIGNKIADPFKEGGSVRNTFSEVGSDICEWLGIDMDDDSKSTGQKLADSAMEGIKHGFNPWVWKIPWRREWLPTTVFLPKEFHGQRSLMGYSPWDHRELVMTELVKFYFHFGVSQVALVVKNPPANAGDA